MKCNDNVGYEVQGTGQGITSLVMFSEPILSSRTRKLATQRFFLGALYQLMASMFECSKDFMADWFVSNVWPLLAKQFSYFLRVPDGKERCFPSVQVLPKHNQLGVFFVGEQCQYHVHSFGCQNPRTIIGPPITPTW